MSDGGGLVRNRAVRDQPPRDQSDWPALVLVHGGAHAGDCWDLTVEQVGRLAPRLRVLAVDLPGRAGKSGDLATLTLADWVESVVADIEACGLGPVVMVGHSMAGIVVPAVVAKLGWPRVRELVLVAAEVPPQGSAVVDSLRGPVRWYARRGAQRGHIAVIPRALAWCWFCNGMSREHRRFALAHLYPESIRVIAEPVDRRGLPVEVPRTWVLTQRDWVLRRRAQYRSMSALGGVGAVIPMQACHDAMIDDPAALARILVERCRRVADLN